MTMLRRWNERDWSPVASTWMFWLGLLSLLRLDSAGFLLWWASNGVRLW